VDTLAVRINACTRRWTVRELTPSWLATASSVSRSTCDTRNGWKLPCLRPVTGTTGTTGPVVVSVVTQIALTWSKGSRQAWHCHSDLQAVEPKWLVSRVSRLPHCGQRTDSVSATGPPAGSCGEAGPGGAMP